MLATLYGILSKSQHTAQAYPGRFFDEEWASDSIDNKHSMQNKAEYVCGYRHRGRDRVRMCTKGCERDRDERAACRGLREHLQHIHELVAQLPP